MKNRKRRKFIKSSLLLIAVAALLVAAVGGTVAYLVTNTSSVVNTFTPAKVNTEPHEEFNNSQKKNIIVANKNDSIPVYIRVALVGNWVKDGDVVDTWTPSFTPGNGWTNGIDGYYYYDSIVAPGGSTSDLLGGGSILAATRDDGAVLQVTVLSQAIQAEGMGVNSAQQAFSKAAESSNS